MQNNRRFRRERRAERASAKRRRAPAPPPTTPPGQSDAELIDRFIEETKPRRPDASRTVLTLALEMAFGDHARFLEGTWITTALSHVHARYDGPGFRDLATIALIERFIDWLFARGELSLGDHNRLAAQADLARVAAGAERRRPAVILEPCHDGRLDPLIARFHAEAELSPLARDLAPRAIRLLAALITGDEGPLLFGRLRPREHMVWLHFAGSGSVEEEEADRQLLGIWGAFYRWLGAAGLMAPERALAIERELAPWALTPPMFHAVA